ncbi:tenascin-like [Microplitis mediator]|uniref:tenascin-like n=1 Tax=Microplitis mediator TaxID=375433 RepID=UPI0025548C1F|nr:tenascin-like [Microplitis mediator]
MVNNTYCQPELGSFCWKNETCATDHSSCISFECQCNEHYLQQSDNQCIRTIGSPCETDFDCGTIKFSYCSANKTCTCSLNTLVTDDQSCLPLLNLYCQTDDECKIEHSLCIDNECKCKPLFEAISNVECRKPYLGMACEHTFYCDKFIRYSKCSEDKQCTCAYHRYIIDNSTCAPLSIKAESCNKDSDCINVGQECYNEKCVCKINFFPLNSTKCVARLYGYCSNNEECFVKNSICVYNRCACDSSYWQNSPHTCEPTMLGEPCTTDKDCRHIRNSRCSADNECICEINHFALDKLHCVPTIDGFCSKDRDCYSDSFRCVDNQCQCKSNYTAVSVNRCVETHSLSSCNDNTECSDSWHSFCSKKGKCVCALNNIQVSSSTCLPILDGPCWKDDQCMALNSVCIDFRCKCKENFIGIANNLCVSIN